jgi:cell division protein FtsB
MSSPVAFRQRVFRLRRIAEQLLAIVDDQIAGAQDRIQYMMDEERRVVQELRRLEQERQMALRRAERVEVPPGVFPPVAPERPPTFEELARIGTAYRVTFRQLFPPGPEVERAMVFPGLEYLEREVIPRIINLQQKLQQLRAERAREEQFLQRLLRMRMVLRNILTRSFLSFEDLVAAENVVANIQVELRSLAVVIPGRLRI